MYNPLEQLWTPKDVSTRGTNWHSHSFDPRDVKLSQGDIEVKRLFRRVFDVPSFNRWGAIKCWYDEVGGDVRPAYYQLLDGIYVVGCFYGESDGSIDIATHFFVRRLSRFRGGLVDWRQDVTFPTGTRKFSVFALTPDSYCWSDKSQCDPYNHAVTVLTFGRLSELGVDMTTLIDHIRAKEFACEAPT